ncbi:MAG: PrsW family intramembrane metalloprotease [Chloroflexi bacterium]|nr:PrsW family intramembrane metalloprotease [Chloroflexota bacterium]
MSRLSLLTPPQEKEEIHPYRRPWRSIAVESGVLFVVAGLLYILANILGVQIPDRFHLALGLVLALLPLGLWLAFSWWAERSVPQPRQRLLAVMIVSSLAANAVGIPLVKEFFQVDRWLPLSSAISRIIGYTFTVGIVQEMVKYIVIRYTAWPDHFRTRLDGVAYSAAAAVGYATVLNLHFVFTGSPAPDVVAGRVFDNVVFHLVTSLIVGYGLAETRFGLPTPLFIPSTIALAALVTGIAIPVRAGLVNPSFGLEVSPPKFLFGLGFAAVLLVVLSVVIAFLYNSAERRQREAAVE